MKKNKSEKRLLPLSPNPFATDTIEISWQIRGKIFHFVASFLRFEAVKQAIKKVRKTQCLSHFPWFYGLFILLLVAGLEPARAYTQQILSLHRLPFRHTGLSSAVFQQPKYSLAYLRWIFKTHLKIIAILRFQSSDH